MRVLVVSSSAAERARASSGLEARDGVQVDEATSAAQAHRMVASGDYDVLVIDGDMRPEGGQSMLYEIRADSEFRGIAAPPAIILMGREHDRWLSAWAGAHEAVIKPVDPFELADRVLDLAGDVAPADPGQTTTQVEADRPSELAEPGTPEAPEPGTPEAP